MTTPYVGEIRTFTWDWAPRGWALCDGRLLPVAQNQALYALLGTTYGGDGRSTFGLPDLRGRVPINVSASEPLGTMDGTEQVMLSISTMPAHTHPFIGTSATAAFPGPSGHVFANDTSTSADFYAADSNTLLAINPATIDQSGGGQAHPNMQPYLVVSCCIALSGIFPSRN